MTAQDRYRQMLKDCITPVLREGCWKGGSGRYYLTGATGHVGSLILSGSHSRSNAAVRAFYLHVGVVSHYLREFLEGTGQASTKRPSTALEHDWFEEVASFTIAAEDDPMEVGGFVLTIIETQAIPTVIASLEDGGLRDAVDNCPVGVGMGGSRTLMEIAQGNLDTAYSRIVSSEATFGSSAPGVVFLRRRLHEATSNRD